ncbi:MAG: Tm-1-like ATP-binding domain-containing protein [Verrucomicrobiota bacterium]
MATIAVIGTLDTKGREHQFIADCISQSGHQAYLIDVGTGGEPQVNPYMTREAVASVGGINLNSFGNNRDLAVNAMCEAAPKALLKLIEQHKIHGVISLGGGGGTAIATAAMRALPLGFPKVMLTILATGKTSQFLGTKDIVMIPSIIDIEGLNRVSRPILAKAAGAICGMVEASLEKVPDLDKPLILASMFTNTTIGVGLAKKVLEKSGFEVVVFHASGVGGLTLESIVDTGVAAGVLDMTTTELADEIVGGVHSAGPTRLDAAGRSGTPAVIVPGCVDNVNFKEESSIPEQFAGRKFHSVSPQVTLMRTNAEECAKIGKALAEKVNKYNGPVTVLLPLAGVSAMSVVGAPFHDPEADKALFTAIKANLRPGLPLIELDAAINDPFFAEACANALLENINRKKHS